MFHYLDDTLDKLLNDAVLNTPPLNSVFQKLYDADISFITPEKGHTPSGNTEVNLFLYETKENRELRDPLPSRELVDGQGVRRRAALRVDCAYMVTAWSKKKEADGVALSHNLLGQAFNWLSRFPVIPDSYLPAGMTGQVFAPPTMVAQMDGGKSAGEFWSALGIPPRPYFNLIVTICMELDQSVEDSIVTTVASRYQANDPASADELMMIGGTVWDSGNPVPDAWVRLEPLGLTQVTDAAGRFIFEGVGRGTGYILRVRARGHQEVTRPSASMPGPLEVPSLTGEYDINL